MQKNPKAQKPKNKKPQLTKNANKTQIIATQKKSAGVYFVKGKI